MSLFQDVKFTSHAGKKLDFKIECDALTQDDWDCIAHIISKKFKWFVVFGVPTGGNKLANALKKYSKSRNIGSSNKLYLLVDDVFTTGDSMEREIQRLNCEENIGKVDVQGVVLFARGKCPNWITPIFQLNI